MSPHPWQSGFPRDLELQSLHELLLRMTMDPSAGIRQFQILGRRSRLTNEIGIILVIPKRVVLISTK
jgi:hypothetical protein